MTERYVAVIGAGSASRDEVAAAETIARSLATAGVVVVCGGLGGVMEAAARGARAAGGLVLGVLPDDDRSRANPYCTVTLPTGLGEARNALVVRAADVVIAIGGSYGTLSEIALALVAEKPVIGYATVECTIGDQPIPVTKATSPEHAVTLALELLAAEEPV